MLKKYGGALDDDDQSTIPIYRASLLRTGGAHQHGLRQMLMDMDASGESGLASSLNLDSHDLEKLTCLDDDNLCRVVSYCMKLHSPLSEAAYPLFSSIKDKLESIIRDIGDEDLPNRCFQKDKESDDPSSSPLLSWSIKDESFRKKLTDKQLKALEKWKYPGWCPMDASKRLKKLLNFPLDAFPDSTTSSLLALSEAARLIAKPSVPDVKEKTEDRDPKEEKCDTIMRRIMSLRGDLKDWEKYYADSARNLSKLHMAMLLDDE